MKARQLSFRTVLLGLMALLLVLPLGLPTQRVAADGVTLIASAILGQPVGTGHYLFWVDAKDPKGPIYGYDVTSQKKFLVTAEDGDKHYLASDGNKLVWVESSGPAAPTDQSTSPQPESIRVCDLTTGVLATVLQAADTTGEFGGLALDNGVLYYQDGTQGHTGLYMRNLATGQDSLVSATGESPVAADSSVAWSEEQFVAGAAHMESDADGNYISGTGTYTWTLHLEQPARQGGLPDTILATGPGPFGSYHVSGDSVIWAAMPPSADRAVHLYSISAGTNTVLFPGPATNPIVSGSDTAYTVEPSGPASDVPQWTIQAQPSSVTVIQASSAQLETSAILPGGILAFTVQIDPSQPARSLYLSGLAATNTSFAATQPPTSLTTTCPDPLSCGQVTAGGTFLYDGAGRWTVNGIMYLLPQFGINGWTFYGANYQSAVNGGSLEWWLGQAQTYLLGKTLRIFVDLPGDGQQTADINSIYNFALRANNHGMRLGVVLHNSANFGMTSAKQTWINNFITTFQSNNKLALLAYVSADNEINNHCNDGQHRDCYDINTNYVISANNWVAAVTSIFRSRNTHVLTTVGISTELNNADGLPAGNDFFRVRGTAPRLVDSVDFVSPHNYHAGGYGIWSDIRNGRHYNGPITLEEYGYPTDPVSQRPDYTEGPPVCQTDPLNPQCTNTAPYFVEVNAKSIRERDYAGGVAWMLADIEGGTPCTVPDLYTGLFTVNKQYCGGTSTPAGGNPKSTAFRIRTHHFYYH